MSLFFIIFALVGISLMVFIHEAGHFLAAKRVGVRVERFAIGFDPPIRGQNLRIFSFRRGETEYVLGGIPFGGYVKLAGGEMMLEPGRTPLPDELPGKPVGARALVFVAGSVFNVVSAFVFFMIAFAMGVPLPEPRLGSVIPGLPAWEAGLRPEDTVLSIDGEEITEFNEVKLAVALGSASRASEFRVSRPLPGQGSQELTFQVTPRWNKDAGFNIIGATATPSTVVAAVEAGSAAEAAGLRVGDRIVGLDLGTKPLPAVNNAALLEALEQYLMVFPASPVKLHIDRSGSRTAIEFTPRKKTSEESHAQLGVRPSRGAMVRAVQIGSDAASVFHARDRLTAIEGDSVHCADWLLFFERWPGKDGKLELSIASEDGAVRRVSVARDAFLVWSLTEQVFWDEHAAEVASVPAGSPLAAAGIRTGDVLVRIGGEYCYTPDEVEEIASRLAAETITALVLRQEGLTTLQLPRLELLGRDLTWRHLRPISILLPGGAAEKAGVTPGSKIVRVGGKAVNLWEDMTEALRKLKPGMNVEIAWRMPTGEERQATATLSASETSESLRFDAYVEKILQVGALESIVVGAKKTLLTAEQLFLTLRSLIRREVSAKNLSGPVGITHFLTKVAEQRSLSLWVYYLALISINLGLFNLLPFPILDGGHILFLLIEKAKGSPVSIKVQEWATNIAFVLILLLAAFVTFNDLNRLLR